MLHILIIWSNALYKKVEIEFNLSHSFYVRNKYLMHWSEDAFLDNLKIFYSHSQYHLPEKEYNDMFIEKMNYCGNGDFMLYVLQDDNPIMVNEETSSGNARVNKNIYDKKQYYRNLTGGGHLIHTSNNEYETNKDLTVLFGLNANDFIKKVKPNVQIEEIARNCTGVGGFSSFKELFYLLNNSISYCVLRNYECLPDNYNVEGHGDIDLLVENKNFVKYLTFAKDVYQLPYRVYHTIMVNEKEVPFDFRYIGDDYYDSMWEKNILQNRLYYFSGFYVPDKKNQFYSLLYHAYVQKYIVAEDYHKKLSYYAEQIGETYSPSKQVVVEQLDAFLLQNGYDYTRPHDLTVGYNEDFLASTYFFQHRGAYVSKNNKLDNADCPYVSIVYKRPESYLKLGSDFLIHNESLFLHLLENYNYFPKIISEGVENGTISYIEISEICGENMQSFFMNIKHHTPRIIHSFLQEILNILRILSEKGIIHRDVIMRNLLIKETSNGCELYLIDFGWAIFRNDESMCFTPSGLGMGYAKMGARSDKYSFGKILREMWPHLPIAQKVARQLIDEEELGNICVKYSLRDYFEIFMLHHPVCRTKITRLSRKLKKIIAFK